MLIFLYLCGMKTEINPIEKQDYRSLSSAERNALRKRAIALILVLCTKYAVKSGKKKSEVAILLGTNNTTISNWYRGYTTNGNKGIEDKKRGAKSENCKLLTSAQELQIQKWITDKYPEQYKLPFALWTCKAVKELIERKFGISISKEQMSKSFKINMISTVTNQGKVQFMIYSENTCTVYEVRGMNADKLIEFLQQLIKTSDQKIFLILDNLKVHHAHIVKDWVATEDIKTKLELFFLPSYSPELNPDEYLNCDLKRGFSDKPAPKNVKELQKNVENHMKMLQQTPDRVAKYFKHEDIQ